MSKRLLSLSDRKTDHPRCPNDDFTASRLEVMRYHRHEIREFKKKWDILRTQQERQAFVDERILYVGACREVSNLPIEATLLLTRTQAIEAYGKAEETSCMSV